MINIANNKESIKRFCTDNSAAASEDFTFYRVAEAAAGDLPNEKVKQCYVCADRGYPHESIEIHKINGRLLNDGTYDAKGYEIREYYTGRPHHHKEPKQHQDQQSQERHYLGWDFEAC